MQVRSHTAAEPLESSPTQSFSRFSSLVPRRRRRSVPPVLCSLYATQRETAVCPPCPSVRARPIPSSSGTSTDLYSRALDSRVSVVLLQSQGGKGVRVRKKGSEMGAQCSGSTVRRARRAQASSRDPDGLRGRRQAGLLEGIANGTGARLSPFQGPLLLVRRRFRLGLPDHHHPAPPHPSPLSPPSLARWPGSPPTTRALDSRPLRPVLPPTRTFREL